LKRFPISPSCVTSISPARFAKTNSLSVPSKLKATDGVRQDGDGRIGVRDTRDALPSLGHERLIGLLNQSQGRSRCSFDRPDHSVDRLELAEDLFGMTRVGIAAAEGRQRLQDRAVEVDLDDVLRVVDERAKHRSIHVPSRPGRRRFGVHGE
jgi:hypothetical protein